MSQGGGCRVLSGELGSLYLCVAEAEAVCRAVGRDVACGPRFGPVILCDKYSQLSESRALLQAKSLSISVQNFNFY